MPDDPLLTLAWVRRACRTGDARAIRLEAHASCAEVGASIDVDQATVWRWENGQRQPRGEAALRYAAVLRLLATTARATAA